MIDLADLGDVVSGSFGAGLWAADIIRNRRITSPPPLLTHCTQRRKHVVATVKYSPSQYLDIWQPRGLNAPAPVLFFIPGGGWVMGHRRPQGYALMSHLVEQGWVCVAIGYRTAPQHHWPTPFHDVLDALTWTRWNIAGYGGDPRNIALAGASAGGHMASLAGLTWDKSTFFRIGMKPKAVVSLYGVYDWIDTPYPHFDDYLETVVVGKRFDHQIWEDASPIHHARSDAPPFLLIHGVNDRVVPLRDAHRFAGALDASMYEVDAGHAFDLTDARRTRGMVRQVHDFLSTIQSSSVNEEAV